MPLEHALRDAEAIVLLVDHRAFQELDVDLAAALVGGKHVLDTRNAWIEPPGRPRLST